MRKSLLVGRFVIAIVFVFYSSLCFAQEGAGNVINTLAKSSKIIESDLVLDDFLDGAEMTRVIVTLSEPANSPSSHDFKSLAFRNELQGAVQAAQERVINRLDLGNVQITNRFVYIFGFSAEVTLEGLKALEELDEVVTISKDRVLEAHLAQGIPLMNASAVRNTYNGSGIAIAICDTGIDYMHPRLGGAGFPNSKVIGGYDCGDDDSDPMDAQGHGTCCAGIAAGDTGTVGDYIGGVAHNAKLYAVKISYGSGGSAYTSDMIEGWEWCITHQNDDPANPIMVISTSFGGGYYTGSCDSASPAMTDAAANCVALGMTLFVSSGNDGFCDGMSWPACITHVNAVGAVYDADFGTYYPCVSQYSCATKYPTGGCTSGYYAIDETEPDMVTSYSNTASFLALLAPSNQAYTTDIVGPSGYSSGSYYPAFGGTSAACPYTAGAAACLQSAAQVINGAFLTPAEVKSTLTSTGDDIIDGKVAITKPRVNLGAAVNSLQIGDELAVDFGTHGLWHYDGSSWTSLAGWNPEGNMVAWTGGLAVDFGASYGLWNYDGSSWSSLAGWNPGYLKEYGTGLAVDFDTYGLWYYNGSSWTNLAGWNATSMEEWSGGLTVDFGTYGLWNYNGSSWTSLAGWNPGYITTYGTGLAVDFDTYGLWYYNGSSWTSLAGWNPSGMEEWTGGLAVDFDTYGLWNYDGSSWTSLAGWNPADMEVYGTGLAVDFSTYGLWYYNGSSWTSLAGWNPNTMEEWAGGLAVDFNTYGLWNYNGSSWTSLAGWDPDYLIDVDLY